MSSPEAIARGWSAADVDPAELVDDHWIETHTRPGRPPSRLRHAADRIRSAAPLRRPLSLSQAPLTRDQMRRIAARTGYPYIEAWSEHNAGSMRGVWGALCHHTGTPWSAAGDYPTLRIVRDGRSDLQNSLCMFGLGRSGTIYLISEKLSWHSGAGTWNGLTDGNGYMAGIEAESDGVHWTDAQVDAYPRLVAAILVEINSDDRYTTRHASYATPAGRKIDFAGWPQPLQTFWDRITFLRTHPEQIDHTWTPGPTPAPSADPGPPLPGWPLQPGHFFGPAADPRAVCHGGANSWERPFVATIQRRLIFKGCVPTVPAVAWSTSNWADGKWEQPTTDAMTRFHQRFYPGQPQPGECWKDDWQVLGR